MFCYQCKQTFKGTGCTVQAAFSTLTNVEFDPDRIFKLINEAVSLREALKGRIKDSGGTVDYPEGAVIQRTDLSLEAWLGLTFKCGRTALKTMELLDAGQCSDSSGNQRYPVGTHATCFPNPQRFKHACKTL